MEEILLLDHELSVLRASRKVYFAPPYLCNTKNNLWFHWNFSRFPSIFSCFLVSFHFGCCCNSFYMRILWKIYFNIFLLLTLIFPIFFLDMRKSQVKRKKCSDENNIMKKYMERTTSIWKVSTTFSLLWKTFKTEIYWDMKYETKKQ